METDSDVTAQPAGLSPIGSADVVEALHPCPFCNGTRIHAEHGDFDSTYIFCNDCGAHGPNDIAEWSGLEPEEYEREARRLWNKRDLLWRATNLIECLVENDPDEAISDAGHTVLDKWRYDAKDFLASLHREAIAEAPTSAEGVTDS